MIATQRFTIRRDKGWRPILALFGGTTSRSYVEIGTEALHVRFGWFYYQTIRFDEIMAVQRSSWPWWGGLGWRSNLFGRIGLVGSYSGIVDILLRRRRWVWLVILPLPCTTLTLSLEDPEGFVAALSPRLAREV